MSDFYDPTKTAELKTRRCHWVAEKCDLCSALLIQDGFHQLELADAEAQRLEALYSQQAAELQHHKQDATDAWELVAAHIAPRDLEGEDEDWQEDTGAQALPAPVQNNA